MRLNMALKRIAVLWIFVGALLLAQKVTQIKFEGLAYLSPNTAKEIADIRVGDEMNAEKIDQSVKNFYAQGYFKDVWAERKGGTLIYHFEEKRAIANVKIKGYGTEDDADKLLKSIGLKKGDFYDEVRVNTAKKKLISKLEAQGSYDSVVEVTTKEVGDRGVSVVFEVNKGEKIKIEKINFIGASELSHSDLEMDIVNKEKDFLGWLPFLNNGEVNVEQLEYDAYRIKETYMKHGYLDAQVSKPLMRVDYSSYTAEIDYQIKEGKRYRVGQVSISQNVKGLDTKELAEDLSLIKGNVFNIKKMRRDMKMLEEKAGNLGYAYAKVSPQMHKDEEKHTVSLQYVINPGKKVKINDVIISGNDVTKDKVVRRYVYLAPGDLYNATDMKDSKNTLGRTGYFEKVDIQSQRVSEDKIDLLVKVKETSTNTISFGGGYGSYEGLMVNGSLANKNIFGSGINTNIGFEVSGVSQNYNVSFVNPRVWDSMYSLGISFNKRDYEYVDYSVDELGTSINVGRQFYRNLYASIGFGYRDKQSNIKDDTNLSDYLRLYYQDKYTKTSVFFNLKYDNTDNYYLPREGFIAALNLEYAQLDGDLDENTTASGYTGFASFIKAHAKFGIFYGMEDILDYDLILRYKAKYSAIIADENEYIPIAERLLMGGVGTVRGYDPYSISPQIDGGSIGGTERFTTSVEASIPLSEAAKMRLTFFYDFGILSSDAVLTMSGPEEFDNVERSSAGAQIEWQSGFGLINLVFAYPIDKQEGDETSIFEFSMGTKF